MVTFIKLEELGPFSPCQVSVFYFLSFTYTLMTTTRELFRLSLFLARPSKNCDTDCGVILWGFSGTDA